MALKPTAIVAAFSNTYFEDIVARWRAMLAEETPPDDLPPSLRRELAQAALGFIRRDARGYDRNDFAKAVRKASRQQVSIAAIKKSFERPDSKMTWTPHLTALLQERFRGETPMFEAEFNTYRFEGPNAPFVFCRRLMGLPRMEQWWGIDVGHRGQFEEETRERQDFVTKVNAFLAAESTRDEASATRTCMVVHSAQAPRGLNALAAKLMKEQREESDLRVIPRCLLSVSPHAPPYKGVDLPILLEQMLAFYEGGPVPERKRAMADADVRTTLARIRRYMALFPATFIFDGVVDFQDDYPDLRACMVDDPFAFLIDHLLLPDLGDDSRPALEEVFHRNRFLVLSDGPCDWLGPFRQAVEALPAAKLAFIAKILVVDEVYKSGGPRFWEHEESEKIFNEGSELSAWFDRFKGEPEAAFESNLQFVDGLLSLGEDPLSLAAPIDIANRFVRRLQDWRPSWLLPLLFLTITPGGLFHQTLFRLLDAWRHRPPEKGLMNLTADFTGNDLVELVEKLSAMVSSGEDQSIPDLYASSPSGMRLSINFRTPAAAARLAEALLPWVSARDLALAHTILAEESIHQHTLLMRYTERDDHSSLRQNRRLIQGVYHGLMSINPDLPVEDGPTIGAVLPVAHLEKARRLYAMFYRLLLESPPNWEMSRVRSAEGVKRDLLRAMVDLDRTPHMRSRPPLPGEPARTLAPPTWLQEAAGRDPTTHAILRDLLHGLCQASLQLNEFGDFDQALALARDEVRSGVASENRHVEAAALDKLEIDAHILRLDLGPALRLTLRRLLGLGFPLHARKAARSQLRAGLFPTGFSLAPLIAHLDPDVIARATCFLERWAEILATNADAYRPLAPSSSRGADPELPATAARRLTDAYVLFALADEARRQTFANDPLGREFVLSGHATRLHIRVLTLMQRGHPDSEAGLALRKLAHRRADSLTRTFARYPVERASMLILESLLVRMPGLSEETLRRSLDFILDADRQMIWATDRPRLRMRLLFERSKIMRRLARELKGPSARALDDWARWDAVRLGHLAHASRAALWIDLSNRALAKTKG